MLAAQLRSRSLVLGLCVLIASDQVHASLGPPLPQASVPFTLVRNEIVATVRINGRGPFTVLLDTGPAPSVIDLSLARKMGLKLEAASGPSEGGGTEAHQTFTTHLPDVVFGKLNTPKVEALATDLSGLKRAFNRPIDAVLGDSFFSNRVVQFDYVKQIARLYTRSPISRTAKVSTSSTVPFKHVDGEVHFSGLRINGKAVTANLDTGSNGEFSLTPNGISLLGLDREALSGKTKLAAGFNGRYKTREGTLSLVEFGNYRVHNAPTAYWMAGTGHDTSHWDVNVGNLFLKEFVVTIDYQADLLTLSRH